MKIDFHTHGKLAKKLPFSEAYTDWLFQEARRAGLDAICLTEHFNTYAFEELYTYIEKKLKADGDSFLAGELRVFPGMEVDVAEGGHVLVIGKLEHIRAVNQLLDPYKTKGQFIPFEGLLAMTKKYPLLIGAGHPFREGSKLWQFEGFDFIDLNGKDMACNQKDNREKVKEWSRSLGIPIVGGSDTHQALQYACVYSEFESVCHTIEDLREGLKTSKVHTTSTIAKQVESASLLKKAFKAIYTLGGDYTQVFKKGIED
ncbi:MAG: PHP domain-containing protein [Cellulosilyticaceae bacterium]